MLHLKCESSASTIATIYKERWQIELFFKALKQNLKVKTFIGTTENALRIQIWTAVSENLESGLEVRINQAKN